MPALPGLVNSQVMANTLGMAGLSCAVTMQIQVIPSDTANRTRLNLFMDAKTSSLRVKLECRGLIEGGINHTWNCTSLSNARAAVKRQGCRGDGGIVEERLACDSSLGDSFPRCDALPSARQIRRLDSNEVSEHSQKEQQDKSVRESAKNRSLAAL